MEQEMDEDKLSATLKSVDRDVLELTAVIKEEDSILRRKIQLLNIELNPYSKDALAYIIKKRDEEIKPSNELSLDEKTRKYNNYASKLKASIKLYITLNDKLEKDIKFISKLDPSKCEATFEVPSKDEIQILENKLDRYEHEMTKFEKRYPWLKDSKYDISNISKDIDKLIDLRKKKSLLLEQINQYDGLSPNCNEAKLQLDKLRSEFTEINKKFGGI